MHSAGGFRPDMNHAPFRPVELAARAVNRAVGELRRGVPVVLLGEADLRVVVLPAETATQATLEEYLAAASGVPVLMLAATRAADLGEGGDLPLAVALPVDAARLGAAGLRALADPTAQPPAYAAAVQANALPVELSSAGLTLAKIAWLLPAVLMAQAGPATDGLLAVRAADVLAYPHEAAETLARVADARVPLEEAADARVVAFRPQDGGVEHLAVLIGHPETAGTPLVRVHSECFTGDILGSRRCDCGPQLHQAIRRMEAEGAGVLLYMAQEGRGIGLVNKLRAYTLQDGVSGRARLDTLDANRALGYGADERSFAAAAAMLRALGIGRIRLLTNNPAKVAGLSAYGIEVAGRLSHAIAANGENDSYLETKARRFGHLLG